MQSSFSIYWKIIVFGAIAAKDLVICVSVVTLIKFQFYCCIILTPSVHIPSPALNLKFKSLSHFDLTGELLPDLYNYAEHLERKLKEIKDSEDISKHNKDKIIEFQTSCLAKGMSNARMLRYLNDLP